jgi:RHS repeat-associated protein
LSRTAFVLSPLVAVSLVLGVVPMLPATAATRSEPAAPPAKAAGPDGSTTLVAPDAVSARAIARLQNQPVEIVGERSETSSTYAQPDGSLSLGTAAAPIWVRKGGDGSRVGDWALVDTTLVANADGSVSTVATTEPLKLSGARSARAGGSLLSFGSTVGVDLSWDGPLPAPVLAGPRATYVDVRPGVDLVVEATRTSFEQFFIVKSRPAVGAEPDLPLTLTPRGGAARRAGDGSVEFVDGAGKVLGHLTTPVAWGADVDAERAHPLTQPWVAAPGSPTTLAPRPTPDRSAAAVQRTQAQVRAGAVAPGAGRTLPLPAAADLVSDLLARGGSAVDQAAVAARASAPRRLDKAVAGVGSAVSLQLSDRSFLQDPGIRYPAVLDPTVDFHPWFDTYVQTGVTTDQSTSGELRLGTFNGGTTVARSFMSVDVSPIRGATVYSAQLSLYEIHAYSCSPRNWELWWTDFASASTRANSQPAWHSRYGTSSSTLGYNASCATGWVGVDATGYMQAAAATSYNPLWVGIGLKAENESDTYGWKKFYASDAGTGIPTLWINYNHVPDVPSGPNVQPGVVAPDGVVWSSSRTPTLSATFTDPDGGALTAWYSLRKNGVVQATGGKPASSGSTVQFTQSDYGAPLDEGATYAWDAAASDGVVGGAAFPAQQIRIDTVAPPAPTVTAGNYPSDGAWHNPTPRDASFTIAPAEPTDTALLSWQLDGVPGPTVNPVTAVPGGTAITVPVPTDGKHVLNVAAFDRARNMSTITSYQFLVGRGGLISPEEGDRVVRRARLATTAEPSLTHVQFFYRRGPDGGAGQAVPLSRLTTADGTALSAAWTPISALAGSCPPGSDPVTTDFCNQTGGYALLDAGALLGDPGGPLQVQARLATDAAGTAPYTPNQWITLTVDKNADGAASDQIGPGSVNLLTGDFTVSGNDADEFGLSVGRTSSSRDTGAGYAKQAERLTSTQVSVGAATTVGPCSAVTGFDFIPCNATAARLTTVGHSGSAIDALAVTPDPASTSPWPGDTFAAIGGDAGGFRLGLAPGRRYRASAWMFVPAAGGGTGPVPAVASGYGPGLTAFAMVGSAHQAYVGSHPTNVNTWQQVSVDFTIPANATSGFIRAYSGYGYTSGQQVYFDDFSVQELWAPLGPQWSLATEPASGSAFSSIEFPDPTVAALKLAGSGEVWFSRATTAGQWFPEPGSEDLRLTQPDAATYRITEIDGTVTDFKQQVAGGQWLVSTSSPPVSDGQSRYVYETAGSILRPSRIIAPIESGVDGWPTNNQACTTATPARGCEVLQLVYASATTATASVPGDIAGQLQKVQAWSWDGAAVTGVDVATYRYDVGGKLVEVADPRLPALKTTYAYDGAGRVTTITPAGELPWSMAYSTAGPATTGGGDLVDPNPGRLVSVTRSSLTEAKVGEAGYNTVAAGKDNVTRVVYGVPLTRATGGGYDLNAAAIGTWAQVEAPTDGTAVFGPDSSAGKPVTATSSSPGSAGYGSATVHYLNASGKEVNTASPAAAGTPVQGFVDSVDYDRFGNAVRTLDASNRLLALGVSTNATADLAELNLTGVSSTAARALALSRVRTFSADGLDELKDVGPVQRLAIGSDPNNVQVARVYTESTYDQGKPQANVAYHLVTTSVQGTLLSDGSKADTEKTVNGYDPIDGASATGATSGWKLGSPTVVTGNADGGSLAVVARVRYDSRGRALESRKNGSTGADAGTVKTLTYVAGTGSGDARCDSRPEWAGSPCLTTAAGAVTGADGTRMPTALPEKLVTSYNRFGDPLVVSESGPGVNGGAGQSRTSTTSYDAAGRVSAVELVGTGPGMTGGAAVAKTETVYDAGTGDAVQVKATVGGVTQSTVAKLFDALGRLTRYDDGRGSATDTVFDQFGRPKTITDGTGVVQSLTYDLVAEPRGFVTSVADSVAGTISATYGPDGQVLTQTLPGGVRLELGYDAAGVGTSRVYKRTSDNAVVGSSTILENGSGQWVRHTTSASSKTFGYDSLGRLVSVKDSQAASGTCTWRAYTYNLRGGRTGKSTSASSSSTCTDPASAPGATSTSYAYDSADRLVSTGGTDPGVSGVDASRWAYDPLGRITSMPVTGNPGAVLTNAFFVNDKVAEQTVMAPAPSTAGVAKQTYSLDPIGRQAGSTAFTWNSAGAGSWVQSVAKAQHYDSDTDSPSWIAEDVSLPSEVTRLLDGLDGNLAVLSGKTAAADKTVLQLVDLHGDVMGTLPVHTGQAQAAWSELRYQDSDEFGVPTDLTTGAAKASSGASPVSDPGGSAANRYGWLGGKTRSADALGSVLLMGARLYHPGTGRFLSVDPVPGGNATAYDYCSGDPVNCTDLDGNWGMPKAFKKALKVVAKVAEVASYIPGPIGTAAAAVSAVSYASIGDYGMATQMAVVAAAGLVGANTAVKGVMKAESVAAKAGKVATTGASCAINSFAPGTPVLMPDGTRVPIDQLQVGDLVQTQDPVTGQASAQPVLDVIVGQGDKHLIDIAYETPAGVSSTLTATANHPIWVEGKGWTYASQLTAGDRMRGSTGGLLLIRKVHDEGWLSGQTVYNLHVANTHTYLAGTTPALVHNISCKQRDVAIKGVRSAVRNAKSKVNDGFKTTFDSRAAAEAQARADAKLGGRCSVRGVCGKGDHVHLDYYRPDGRIVKTTHYKFKRK